MPTTNRTVHLKSSPQGMPVPDDFEIRTTELEEPADGQVLIRNIYMSVDPYMRGRMREAWRPGDALSGSRYWEKSLPPTTMTTPLEITSSIRRDGASI